jgi:hypothetical protein
LIRHGDLLSIEHTVEKLAALIQSAHLSDKEREALRQLKRLVSLG